MRRKVIPAALAVALVGPAVAQEDGASANDRLLGFAMAIASRSELSEDGTRLWLHPSALEALDLAPEEVMLAVEEARNLSTEWERAMAPALLSRLSERGVSAAVLKSVRDLRVPYRFPAVEPDGERVTSHVLLRSASEGDIVALDEILKEALARRSELSGRVPEIQRQLEVLRAGLESVPDREP